MLVLLNRERLESALPDVAAAVMMLVITAHMSIQDPMHPAAQVAILLGQDNQVKVVGHEAKAQHGHRDFDAGMGHGLEEGLVVGIRPKNLAPAVAPVDDVVTDPSHRGSRGAWHGRRACTAADRMSIVNVPVPFDSHLIGAVPFNSSL